MPLEQLWATWRSNYVRGIDDSRTEVPTGEPADGRSLFERILQSGEPDSATLIVYRGETCFVLMNRFPYTSGHLMVLPNRAAADLEELTPDEQHELWSLVRDGVAAVKAALACHGVNVGLNLGAVAGGSQSDHLHVHVVPRWQGDANFMSVAGETRVLPVGLEEAWESIRTAWPDS
ncbi:MAG: HIT domain-containing protein [Actinomycetia bacterium]|nr:HIT domain-containing protein [Actinomycetes bacterium]